MASHEVVLPSFVSQHCRNPIEILSLLENHRLFGVNFHGRLNKVPDNSHTLMCNPSCPPTHLSSQFINLFRKVIWGWIPIRFHHYWLVVLTIWKNISQWVGLSHILWKIKFMFQTTNQVISLWCYTFHHLKWWRSCDPGHHLMSPEVPKKNSPKIPNKDSQHRSVHLPGKWAMDLGHSASASAFRDKACAGIPNFHRIKLGIDPTRTALFKDMW